MLEVRPFRGVRYDLVRAGNPVSLVAPSWQRIDAELREDLTARNPYNVMQLHPVPAVAHDDPGAYGPPNAILVDWLEAGVLRREEEPVFYLYEQRYATVGGRKTSRGILGLMKLEPDNPQVILPYEPHSDRLAESLYMTQTAQANLSPVLALYDNASTGVDDLVGTERSPFPDVALTDETGVEHRLFRVSSETRLPHIMAFFAESTVLIAEGQTTYKAALEYQRTRRLTTDPQGAESQPYDYVLAFLSGGRRAGLTPQPYHRLVKGVRDFEFTSLVKRAGEVFSLASVRSLRDVQGILDDMRDAGESGLAFGLIGGGSAGRRTGYVASLKAGAVPGLMAGFQGDEVLSELDVSIVSHLVLDKLLGIPPDAPSRGGGQHVTYYTDAGEAMQAARAKDAQLLLFMNPTSISQMRAVCHAGAVLPPRTVTFFPKPLTGMVMNDLTVL